MEFTSGGVMTRVFTVFSVAVHAVVVASALVAQVLAVGPLPTPRRPLTFENATRILLTDVHLPAPQRRARTAESPVTTGINAAPIVAPIGIRHESGPEQDGLIPADVVGMERGLGAGAGIGVVERAVPPPPPPAAPQAPVRLHDGRQTPRKIVHVNPIYPRVAQAARVEGVVILDAVIDAGGRVTSVRVLRSSPLLDQAAIDAVQQWTFTPTLLNGIPVPIMMTVTVQFKLQGQ
jgi:periplasmic protein TonB